MKRRGNRRYYQHHEVLMIRRIRELLYDQGFTISGARNKLHELVQPSLGTAASHDLASGDADGSGGDNGALETLLFSDSLGVGGEEASRQLMLVRRELFEIRALLAPTH